jgi:tetratricopeptide (TPR) repeat protein
MSAWLRNGLTVVALAAGLALAAVVLRAGDASDELAPPAERLLYVRSGALAHRLALSFDAVAADVYWIRTIQHYGRDRRSARTSGRFELLQPLLDLTTTLDPYFNIAYRFGAIFLASVPPDGPGRPDQAIALLKKGLASRPDRWQYALDIGFVHYWHTGDFKAAAEWFARAAAMPNAPAWLRPLAVTTLAQGGDRRGARLVLHDMLASEEEWIRRAAARGLMQMDALDLIDVAQAAVDKFVAVNHTSPTGWADLVRAGLLPGIPLDPLRVPFEFDATTKRVILSPASPLGPLPGLPTRS